MLRRARRATEHAPAMLLEQAFHALPEILCGSRYPGQDYESGVVMALTMAILQELNGRNVPNPLGCIQGECLYEKTGFANAGANPRYLRADLVLDTRPLWVASKRLGDRYEWRHFNWLEAKFFRARTEQKGTNKTAPTASLLADLLRLASLVPEKPGKKSENGRYLLHIYDRVPTEYIATRRNKKKNDPNAIGGTRQWATALHTPGVHQLRVDSLDKEPASFQATLGAMGTLQLNLEITNIVLSPRAITNPNDGTVYWCVLTRIDKVECLDGARTFSIGADRLVSEGAAGDFEALRTQVALALGEVPEAEKTKPEDPALVPGDESGEEQPAEAAPEDGVPPVEE